MLLCALLAQAGVYKNVLHAAREITNAAGVRGLFTVRCAPGWGAPLPRPAWGCNRQGPGRSQELCGPAPFLAAAAGSMGPTRAFSAVQRSSRRPRFFWPWPS